MTTNISTNPCRVLRKPWTSRLDDLSALKIGKGFDFVVVMLLTTALAFHLFSLGGWVCSVFSKRALGYNVKLNTSC